MASIKRLKKDIDYLTFSVVGDCLNYSYFSGKSNEQLSDIVQDIINTRNDLRARVVAGRKVAKDERHSYFRAVFKDLLIAVDGSFTKLSETIKQA